MTSQNAHVLWVLGLLTLQILERRTHHGDRYFRFSPLIADTISRFLTPCQGFARIFLLQFPHSPAVSSVSPTTISAICNVHGSLALLIASRKVQVSLLTSRMRAALPTACPREKAPALRSR